MLGEFAFAVDDNQPPVRDLQGEGGPVNFEGFTDSNVVIDGSLVIRVFSVLTVQYLHVELLR